MTPPPTHTRTSQRHVTVWSLVSYSSLRITQIKGKVHPITGHKDPEGEQSYSSVLSLTSPLDGVGGQRHAPAALPPGKTR